jgi:hypothetical protein
MSDPQTIRELWERVLARNAHGCEEHDPECPDCCDQRDAVAALDLLDNALHDSVILPPHQNTVTRVRLVPDPAPRGDAE